ncbi:hypothetical protein QYE76_004424 [Lolium multiflorum]|uniref:Integrase catalytic domain-containing protein n=1 Tax=Lolium multiflorum TaxID=4521 RepID=A0AAD8W1D7_LOLMU|nr:hypothetical protein QYE76_004424 [Lolium multiflorum]
MLSTLSAGLGEDLSNAASNLTLLKTPTFEQAVHTCASRSAASSTSGLGRPTPPRLSRGAQTPRPAPPRLARGSAAGFPAPPATGRPDVDRDPVMPPNRPWAQARGAGRTGGAGRRPLRGSRRGRRRVAVARWWHRWRQCCRTRASSPRTPPLRHGCRSQSVDRGRSRLLHARAARLPGHHGARPASHQAFYAAPSLPGLRRPSGRDPVGSRALTALQSALCWGVWWRWRLVHGHRRLRAYGRASRDVWTSPVPSNSGYNYYLVILDDYSHFVWTFPLRRKSDVATTLTAFFAFVSTQFGRPIHALQTDNGKEFDNITIRSLLATHGAIFRLTCPYTSSQNGRAERMLRTLNDCVRTLLFHASMPPRFWPDATATLLVNIRPCRVRWFYTPHHLLYGAPPTYDDLRIFGCREDSWRPSARPGARWPLPRRPRPVAPSAGPCIPVAALVPPPRPSPAATPRAPAPSPAASPPAPAPAPAPRRQLRRRVARRAIASVAAASPSTAPRVRRPSAPSRRPPFVVASPPVAAVPEPMLTRARAGVRRPSTRYPADQYVRGVSVYRVAPGRRQRHCRTTAAPLHRPTRPSARSDRPTACRPVRPARRGRRRSFAGAHLGSRRGDPHWRAAKEGMTRCSAIGPGSSFPGPSRQRHLRQMGLQAQARLRRYSRALQGALGVLHLAASRAWPVHQMDVSNAFLHGHLQEQVSVGNPSAVDTERPDDVCLLSRSLWTERRPRLVPAHRGFLHRSGRLRAEFALKDLGPLHYFLGIEVVRRADGFFLHQRKYAHELLERAGCLAQPCAYSCRRPSSPPVMGSLASDAPLYRSIVGALQYLTTRPELQYAVQQVCLHMHAPRDAHWAAVKRILRYVWYHGLRLDVACFALDVGDLVAYSDADRASCRIRAAPPAALRLPRLVACLLVFKRQPTVSRSV